MELAAKCITALHARYPDLRVTNSNSTPDRERTIADLTLTAEGQKGTGHGYFFHTQERRQRLYPAGQSEPVERAAPDT